jgi:hypothetical protein
MTKSVTILFLLFSMHAFGQLPQESIYKTISGLTIVDSVYWPDVDRFYTGDGFGGYSFRLESNEKFKKVDFSCIGSFTIDSGTWAIKDQNTLLLKSSTQTLLFDIVRFNNFYFFIPPAQRQKFVDDLKALRAKLKNWKPFTIDNKTYTADYLIGSSLIRKYYAKEIEETPGT